MTNGEIIGRVSERLAEGAIGPTFYPRREILAAVNEAQRFFAFLTLGLEKTDTWTIPAYSTNGNSAFHHMLQYFPDWIAPLSIATQAGVKVRPTGLEALAGLDSQWWNSPGSPTRYTARGVDLVGIYKQPAGSLVQLEVTYARAPLALVDDTDVPEIPAEYHGLLPNYGIYRCRQVEGGQEFQKTLAGLDEFFEGAGRYAKYVRTRNLGARYDTLPFELQKFDRSKMLKLRVDLPPARPVANNPM